MRVAAWIVVVLALIGCQRVEPPRRTRLYWFIPDGLRAEPDLFTVFRWAEEGKLPNLKRMMEQGAWGYSIPDFPSHTPANFATLLTGSHPVRHGIADGPMHVEGAPLVLPSVGGFSSNAKRVSPFWMLLENAGLQVALLSIPGSTPPQLRRGITVRGRWGGWGFDAFAINYEPESKLPERKHGGRAFRLFFLGQKLTDFVPTRPAAGWSQPPPSHAPALEATLPAHGTSVHIHVSDSTDDRKTNYDTVRFALDKDSELFTLRPGSWSDWRPITLRWKDQPVLTQVRARVIKLWPESGEFRIRLFFSNANRLNTEPPEVADALVAGAGPMVDFADNWPAQLVAEPEDEGTFLTEAQDSLAWHRRAARFMLETYRPDVLIQDTYTPNQTLEARWWLRWVDPGHPDHDPARAPAAWRDILSVYQGVDAVLGEAMAAAGDDAIIAFSSDHGIIPLVRQVHLNNLFAKKGWLRYQLNPTTGEPTIDWQNTKVIYLKMDNVYVHPQGLAGDWRRGQGPAYEKLRGEVAAALRELADEAGNKPLVRAVRWEDAAATLDLPPDRVGDLVLEAVPGYQWHEEVTAAGELFATPLNAGYKQAINPKTTKGVWTPFAIMGPGVKKGIALSAPISHADQMPTLLRLLGLPIPEHVQGRVLGEILER
jgi:predicted AlkP superfamily phosphohydrolase/phosphomutase